MAAVALGVIRPTCIYAGLDDTDNGFDLGQVRELTVPQVAAT